jgi:hypothetical protein
MSLRTVSSTPTASGPFGTETGSQTTEYALIMVITATKLRAYDSPPSFL